MSSLRKTHFELFSLPERYALDERELARAFQSVRAAVHPDRFAGGGDAQQRVAMQMAAQVNEAYRVLSRPLERAAYLCELHGAPIDADHNTAMPGDFLIEQMQWRESLDDARSGGDRGAIAGLRSTLGTARERLRERLRVLIDENHDHPGASAIVRQLMFVEKFALELDAAVAALAP